MAARLLATAKHLARSVIAGLVPAIHAGDRLLASLERLGAAAEWALGTSPRATTGMVGCAGAITANDLSISCGLAPGRQRCAWRRCARTRIGILDRTALTPAPAAPPAPPRSPRTRDARDRDRCCRRHCGAPRGRPPT